MASEYRNFMGAKLALFVGAKLLSLHRDNAPGLLWPGFWDLPGGGREGDEDPVACALRETREEFSLHVPRTHLVWGRPYTNSIGRTVWFFVGHVGPDAEFSIRLGDEGQGWRLFSPRDFIAHEKAIPQFQERLVDYLAGVNSWCFSERPPAD